MEARYRCSGHYADGCRKVTPPAFPLAHLKTLLEIEHEEDAHYGRLVAVVTAPSGESAKRGLWKDANPVAPWEFRHEKR